MRDVQLLEMTNYLHQSVLSVQAYLEGGEGGEDVGVQSGELVTAQYQLLQSVVLRK